MSIYQNKIYNLEKLTSTLKQCKRQQQYSMGKARAYWKSEEKRICDLIAGFYGKSSRDQILNEVSASVSA